MFFFFQAEDGIRDLVRSRGLGDVYKRQARTTLIVMRHAKSDWSTMAPDHERPLNTRGHRDAVAAGACLLYTSDAADERSSVDLGGRRIIKKKKQHKLIRTAH